MVHFMVDFMVDFMVGLLICWAVDWIVSAGKRQESRYLSHEEMEWGMV
jgi:hypothetical protein